jgi:multidrug efflux pump subunit AcrA (membrane-fusion protein)
MNTTLKILITIVVTLSLIGATLFGILQYQEATTIEFESVALTRGTIEDTLSIEGVVSAEKREILFSAAGDRVSEVRFGLGDEVQQDDVILVFENEVELTAPFAGTILEINAYEGQRVVPAAQEPSVLLADLDSRIFTGEVDEDDISKIKTDQDIVFSCDLNDASRLEGRVNEIGRAAKKRVDGSMYFEVIAEISELEDFSKKDTFSCDAEVILSSRRNVIIAPFDAVAIRDGRPIVYVVSEDGTPTEKEIVTGLEGVDGFEVVSGLVDSDIIVRDVQVFEEE